MDFNYKEIVSSKRTKEIIAETVREIRDLVALTFGPNGNTVVIPSSEDYTKFDITKDGVSVVKQIKFKDPVKNIIANFIKDCADRTVKQAGDGTTTATILLCSMISKCIDQDSSSKKINDAFNEVIPKVIEIIDSMKKELQPENYKDIISISCNGDEKITNTIYEIIQKTSNIKLVKHSSLDDIVEYNHGLTWETTYKSKVFVNNPKKESVEYENCGVIVIDGKLISLKPYKHVISSFSQSNKPLVIVTEYIHENALRTLENLRLSNQLDVVVIKTPGLSEHRKNLLRDLAAFTKAKVIKGDSENTITLSDLGVIKSIYSDKIKTIFTKSEDVDLTEYLDHLITQKNDPVLPEYVKDTISQRISILEGSLGVIYVGGNSSVEITERYDRYDDAIKAILSAKEDGILPGGGIVLYNIATDLLNNYEENSLEYNILSALKTPYNKLTLNDTDINLNMEIDKIVDPTKVIKTALINASANAKTILGTKGVLLTNLF